MRDLHLWRLLLSREPASPEELAPLLEALAGQPLNERMPFLGLLGPALADADPRLRRAAVTFLAGARGRPAIQKIVAAFNDADESVKLAAVEALRVSLAGGDFSRWAHALFHPDPAVRKAAI